MDQIALLGRFNDIGAHAIQVYPLCNSAACHYGAQSPRAQFRCFLHHVVQSRMLERRENIIDVGRQFRFGHKPFTAQRNLFLADGCNIGEPLAVPAIEGPHRIASA